MKTFYINILRGFLFIWCFPQNIIGFIYTRYSYKIPFNIIRLNNNTSLFKRFVQFIRTNIIESIYYLKVTEKQNKFTISLGNYIFCKMRPGIYPSSDTLNRENGYRIQSILLGWFYLPIIGISNLIHYIYQWFKQRNKKNLHEIYHTFWTEKWADKLGNM